MSQTEFARRAEVTTSTVSKWLSDLAEPSAWNIVAVAAALGTTPEYLLGSTRESLTDASIAYDCLAVRRFRQARLGVVECYPVEDRRTFVLSRRRVEALVGKSRTLPWGLLENDLYSFEIADELMAPHVVAGDIVVALNEAPSKSHLLHMPPMQYAAVMLPDAGVPQIRRIASSRGGAVTVSANSSMVAPLVFTLDDFVSSLVGWPIQLLRTLQEPTWRPPSSDSHERDSAAIRSRRGRRGP